MKISKYKKDFILESTLIIAFTLTSLYFIFTRTSITEPKSQILGERSIGSLYDVMISALISNVPTLRFTLFGYSSPQALITLESIGLKEQTYANNEGYFEFNNKIVPFASTEPCLSAQDQFGRLSPPLCLPPFPTTDTGDIISIGPIIMPPTISLNKDSFYMGDEVVLSGQTIPNTELKLSIFTDEKKTQYLSEKKSNNSSLSQIISNSFKELIKGTGGKVFMDPDRAKIGRYSPPIEHWGGKFFARIWNTNYIKRFYMAKYNCFFCLIKPVEAFTFPQVSASSDKKGNFSLSLPSANATFFRLFVQTTYKDFFSPKSNTLNLEIFPVWMIIVKLLMIVFNLLKAHWLELTLCLQLIILISYMLKKYLHPYHLSKTRALALREVKLLIPEQTLMFTEHQLIKK